MKSRIYKFLSSYELSVYLLLVGLLYYIFLFAWGLTTPQVVVQNISRAIPFVLLYVIFNINLILCTLNRWRLLIHKSKSKPLWREDCKLLCKIEDYGDDFIERLITFLKYRGYRLVEKNMNALVFVKGQWSPLTEVFFHFAFLLIAAGILISLFTRFEGRFNLVEGYTFWGERGEYFAVPEEEIFYSRSPEISFRLEEVGSVFWKDKLFFTDLFARVSYPGDTLAMQRYVRLKSGIRIGLNLLNLEGFGYAPVYQIKDTDGKIINSMTVNLNVFPPPTEDSFLIPDTPYRVYVRFYPDAVLENGKVKTNTFNLENPLYAIRIMRGKRIIRMGNLKPGEEIQIEKLRFSFPELKKMGQFRVVKDYGMPFIWTGIIIGVIGLFWRFFFYRREMYLRVEGDKLKIFAEAEWFREMYKRDISEDIKRIIKQ